MNVVDEIYLLIKNDKSRHTLDNNIDYFQKFYYSSMSINNDYRVIEIFKYLLSLDLTDDFEPMPYLISKIFKSFNDYEMMLTQYCYLKDANLNSEYVKSLFSLINDYYFFKKYMENAVLIRLIDELNFTRNYTGSFMVTLNASFFELPVDMIQQMFLLIKNNIYLQDIIKKGTMNKKMLDLEYIHDYLNKFLFTAEFMNKENINNDELIISLKDGKITDYETLLKITKKCPIEYLLNDEKKGISSFLDIVNKSLEDPYERQIVFNTFLSKLGMREDNRYLLNFIMNDESSKLYIEKNDYDEIIYMAANYDLNNLDSKTCMFLLDKTFSITLLINLKEKLKQNIFTEEEKKQIQKETNWINDYNYSFTKAIEILDKVFKDDKKNIDYMMVFGALKSLAKTFMGDEEIYIYLTEDNNIYGGAYQESKSIVLNIYNIKDLLAKNNLNEQPEVLHINLATDDYGNTRYIGANPNNYVSFDGDIWRIIGVMKNVDDGSGNKEDRVKLIRSEAIGRYSWDTSESSVNNGYGVNEWSQADLMKLLNPGYGSKTVGGSLYWNNQSGKCYNNENNGTRSCDFTSTGIKAKLKSLISDAVWNTGSQGTNSWQSASGGLTKHFYAYERSDNTGKICSSSTYCTDTVERTTTWTGKVGLMYPSDYGYATSGGSTTDRATCLNTILYDWGGSSVSDCKNNDWLFNSNYQWTLSPGADSSVSRRAFDVYYTGLVYGDYAYRDNGVRPVVYLSSNVKISSGTGSESDPFALES